MYRKFKKLVLAHFSPSIFFSRIVRSEALVYNSQFFERPFQENYSTLGSIQNLSRGQAMMISLFFPFIFLKTPPIISGFFSDPPSRGVDLSKENIIAPPPTLSQISRHPDIKLFLNLLHVWMENLDQWTTICQGRKLIISQKQQKR